ncbi:MAG: pyridoxamine 5'-phosphate oxidase family protein [bacterium]
MDALKKFLKSQRLLALAVHGENGPWIANVYFGSDDVNRLYFISSDTNIHSLMILKDPRVAFSTAWFDPTNHGDRKGVQGKGVCRPAKNDEEIAVGVRLHNENFPEFKKKVTTDWIRTNAGGSTVWVVEPSYMKYWDDAVYGDDESEEFAIG